MLCGFFWVIEECFYSVSMDFPYVSMGFQEVS